MFKRGHRVIPLYYQVQHTISQRISRGEYPRGTRLPSESELSQELGVSRVTLREALRVLAQENWLVKVQGRGTFVADKPLNPQPARTFLGYLEDLYDQLERVTVKHTEITRVPLTEEMRSIFKLGPKEKELVKIRRARHVDNEPYAFTTNLLPLEIGRHLNEDNLHRDPLVRILEEQLKIQISHADETIEAAAADAEVAKWLEVSFLSPVMHVRRVLYTAEARALQIVETYYRADKYHYSVHLVRVQNNGKWSWSQKGVTEPAVR